MNMNFLYPMHELVLIVQMYIFQYVPRFICGSTLNMRNGLAVRSGAHSPPNGMPVQVPQDRQKSGFFSPKIQSFQTMNTINCAQGRILLRLPQS